MRIWNALAATTVLAVTAIAMLGGDGRATAQTPAADPNAAKAVGVKAQEQLGADRYALIVGINDYRDPQIPHLKYAEADARSIYDTLTDPQIGGIDSKNATLLLGKDATTLNIRKALAQLRTIPKNSTVFIFFSGHGAKESGEAFWVTQDAELGGLGYSALPDREIHTLTDRIPSNRLIMLLDCCYAAATVKGQKSVVDFSEAMRNFTGKGRVVITGSGSGEESIEAGDLRHGVFAHYLVEGLRGKADGSQGPADGIVTLPELTSYLDRTVADAARQRRGIQKPAIFMEEVQEPAKFLITIDSVRIAALATEAQRSSQLVKGRVDALKRLLQDDAITGEQFAAGRRLLEALPDALDKTDRDRWQVFADLVAGKLDPKYLTAALTSIAPHTTATALSGASGELPRTLNLDCGSGASLDLVLIPAGEFLMGSPENEEGRGSDEGPQHRVRIGRPFCMGKYEVTQGQWQAVMGSDPSHFKGESSLPVEEVSWDDCKEFCRKLSSRTGRTVRLPSEAEWEYACRAGTTAPFSFGATISTDQANYDGNYTYGNGRKGKYREKTTPVGSFPANAWGLYDMHGNVWEWCEDAYHGEYNGVPSGDEAWMGGDSGRVLRGGSWVIDPADCRSAFRYRFAPDVRSNGLGFRVVVSSETP